MKKRAIGIFGILSIAALTASLIWAAVGNQELVNAQADAREHIFIIEPKAEIEFTTVVFNTFTDKVSFGDKTQGIIIVKNDGDDGSFNIMTDTDNSIAAERFTLRVKELVTLPCNAENFLNSGVLIAEGPMGNGRVLALLDEYRPIASGEQQNLCMEVDLPSSACCLIGADLRGERVVLKIFPDVR